MLRCGVLVTARPLLLLALVISHVAALPTSPWAPGRRALGAGPAAAATPKEQAVATNPMLPFMTLKPYLPMKPANPFTPAFVPDPQMFIDKKTELLNNLFSSPMMGGGAFGSAGAFGSVAETAPASKPWAVGPGGPWAPPAPSKRALGPWGVAATPSPWAPTPAATVDPSLIMGKKADFLSKLFSGLETTASKPMAGPAAPFMPPSFWMPFPLMPPTTPAPEVDATAEAKSKFLAQLLEALDTPSAPATPPILLAPTPTSAPKMVVPPSYWIPSSPMAGPDSYMKKVSDYLDKLFDSLNVTASPATEEGPVTRSLATRHHNDEWRQQEWVRAVTAAQTADTPSLPLAAKDLVVNSILNEVGALKSAMLDTLNEMITKQKEAAAAAATTKKPMKFGPFPWGPTPKPTPDPTEPYQKRLETLGQVFDMLTALGQEVATGSSVAPTAAAASNSTSPVVSRVARGLPEQVSPLRSVQMAMHQGYQSMPAGTEEVISAGAGRDPTTAHEGGGLNLKIKIPQ